MQIECGVPGVVTSKKYQNDKRMPKVLFQMSALQILLDEEHLSVEDQQKALSNIKPNYESLQVIK